MFGRTNSNTENISDKQATGPVLFAQDPAPQLPMGTRLAKVLLTEPISTIRLVDALIEDAYGLRASDVHIDPTQNNILFRLRIDGVLQDFQIVPKKHLSEILSRIKILSGLRTDEHQAAQDGRFRLLLDSIPVDVRVSIVPTHHGENAVLRLLAERAEEHTLDSLGFSKINQEKILQAIRKPYGMILATGPTGSGKTTTLYTLAKMLNTKEVSIVTIEDPIEYAIEGINQIQVNPRTNLTFAQGLRSMLRQDPNIIMVGEIRDAETAGIAVNTALTGHLLLSTLHTNDAATTLPRLIDLKIEPYLITSTVNVAIGQRLVRKICEQCRQEKKLTPAERESLLISVPQHMLDKQIFYYGKGCSACNGTGFFGRLGIHEVLVIDKTVREAILQKATAGSIKALAVESGMTTMVEDGFQKAIKGLTTIEEVLRTLYE